MPPESSSPPVGGHARTGSGVRKRASARVSNACVILATCEMILADCDFSTVVSAVDVRRSNVLARSRALLVKRDALFAISTSRTRRFLSLASQCLRLHRSMVVIVLKS
jgi:hypothetical protein